jgi:cobaltochelatase CobN
MHLLPVTTVSLDESGNAVDLGQEPGDVIVLSFTDSDLSAMAAAYRAAEGSIPSLRLTSLRQLKHPLSVDFYVEKTAAHAKFIIVRCLGGLDYWRYGLESLRSSCAASGARLVVLPGDERADPRLVAFSNVGEKIAARCESYFRAGGVANLGNLLQYIAGLLQGVERDIPPVTVPRAFVWSARGGISALDECIKAVPRDNALAYLIVYRSSILSGDTAAVEALASELERKGITAMTFAVSGLKDPDAEALLAAAIALRKPDIVVTTTAFSAREDWRFVLDQADCPIIQALTPGSSHDAWQESPRGLSAADMTMQVVLPEFDGRIGTAPIAFKQDRLAPEDGLGFTGRRFAPDIDGTRSAAETVSGWVNLRRKPPDNRTFALVLSDYPARGGRAGFAVGLDTPASVCSILDLMSANGFDAARDFDRHELMPRLMEGAEPFAVPLTVYRQWFAALAPELREAVDGAWGSAEADPAVNGNEFRFSAVRAGKVLVVLQPDRGRGSDRKVFYHDPDAAPTHAYLAFYLGVRTILKADALIHLGTHGTTEWLPGKALALSSRCWPRVATDAVPVIYPFIVDDPGEAAPAKRRISAVTLGHMTPAVASADLTEDAAVLRELVEEYSSAQTLDPRRADIVAKEILERAQSTGLAAQCGVDSGTPMEDALTRLDAHLCDLGEVTIRDGLHIFGEATPGLEACASGEREGLLRALNGRFVVPGPAGSPSRGRRDVMPTGRNLATLDPRAIPTRAATALGERAANEVIRRHLQDHGEYPRRVVMDLWASPTLRTGGEDMAHALALMGARPVWDNASTRVTGFEVVPAPLLDRPRIDVTIRISGVFRDTFPNQIALLDQAARAIAHLDEDDEWNALAASRRRGETLSRIFGAAPGRYGAGVGGLALDGSWREGSDLAQAYLAATSHAFGQNDSSVLSDDFAGRIEAADAFVHVTDVAERDLLDGDSNGDAIGGFAAAARMLGQNPVLYSLDTSRPEAPKSRTLPEDIARLVHGRLVNPRWIEAQLRHGWRGAAELAQAVDALFVFAATTDAVTNAALDAIYEAYVSDAGIFERIESANPGAARAIVERMADARRRGLWISRRNSVDAHLDALRKRAA